MMTDQKGNLAISISSSHFDEGSCADLYQTLYGFRNLVCFSDGREMQVLLR